MVKYYGNSTLICRVTIRQSSPNESILSPTLHGDLRLIFSGKWPFLRVVGLQGTSQITIEALNFIKPDLSCDSQSVFTFLNLELQLYSHDSLSAELLSVVFSLLNMWPHLMFFRRGYKVTLL